MTFPKTNSRYCAFVKDDFHGDSAVLILTSPETAAGDLGLIEDSDPRWLSPSSCSPPPQIPPYEVRNIPGKELGVVANSTIRAGEVIMRDYPTILQTVSTEVWEQIDPREALWVLEEGFVRLPREVQIRVFELARSTGGHVLEDVLHTNTFAASFNNVSHYGLFTNIARGDSVLSTNARLGDSPLNMLYADRQRTLQEWGFNCTCSLCSSASAVAVSDARRGRMQEIVSALNNKVFRSSPARMAELAEELDCILEEEGLSAQKGDFYDILARAYVDMGEVETGRRLLSPGTPPEIFAAMCIQYIISAICTAAACGVAQKGCRREHVVVSRREVCGAAAPARCMCFFGSCGRIVTHFDDSDLAHIAEAPCEACDELFVAEPEEVLLLKIFDAEFAEIWAEFFGPKHAERCTEGKWLGKYDAEQLLFYLEDEEGSSVGRDDGDIVMEFWEDAPGADEDGEFHAIAGEPDAIEFEGYGLDGLFESAECRAEDIPLPSDDEAVKLSCDGAQHEISRHIEIHDDQARKGEN
ncbi:SET domain-containing protein 5 [Colletotrichum sp. SAR11_240]|nr:SET domain-containing protein 5 [Colletotrichum sp. SAR11_240]